MTETIRITVSLPVELHRKVKNKAAQTGVSMSAICREALAKWVQECEPREYRSGSIPYPSDPRLDKYRDTNTGELSEFGEYVERAEAK